MLRESFRNAFDSVSIRYCTAHILHFTCIVNFNHASRPPSINEIYDTSLPISSIFSKDCSSMFIAQRWRLRFMSIFEELFQPTGICAEMEMYRNLNRKGGGSQHY